MPDALIQEIWRERSGQNCTPEAKYENGTTEQNNAWAQACAESLGAEYQARLCEENLLGADAYCSVIAPPENSNPRYCAVRKSAE